jgi:hypothetical protein
MVATARNYPPPPHKHGPIVMVSSYTSFDDLAHGPRGQVRVFALLDPPRRARARVPPAARRARHRSLTSL